MASTWYSCGGLVTPESGHNTFLFNGVSGTVENFFFYFENAATRRKSSVYRAAELLGHLSGEAFDFYYEKYASDGQLSVEAENYEGVKQSFIFRFGKVEAPEERIRIAVSARLDETDFRSSRRGMDALFQKAGFDDNAKFGLLRKSVMEHHDLAQVMMYRNPLNYADLNSGIISFVSAKETFSVSSNCTTFAPRRVIQRPDAGQRKIEDKVDAWASQLSELSIIVKKSRNVDFSRPSDAAKVCSYCREPGHFSTTCSKNENRDTRCHSCGKLGHSDAQCFKKQQKRAVSANVGICSSNKPYTDSLPTVEATFVDEIAPSKSCIDVVSSLKRTADGEAIPKQARPEGVIPISSLLAPQNNRYSSTAKAKLKKAKAKRCAAKQGLSQYAGKYDVVSELANAGTNLTFGQLIRGDGDQTKSDLRRLLSRGARVRRHVNATLSGIPNPRPRRLKVVKIKAYGLDSEALLHSGAVPNLISERLCDMLSLRFEQKTVGLTVADGQRAHSMRNITDFPIFFGDVLVSMNFYVMKNPPFDVIIGVPTLEALRGCLDFAFQQVTLFAGDAKAVLPFEYAVVEVPVVDNAETDSEGFTSGSDTETDEDGDNDEEFIVALASDFGGKHDRSPQDNAVSESERRLILTLEKVSHSDSKTQNDLVSTLKDSNTIAWSLHDLCPADVPVQHHFELIDTTPIHHRARRMAPKHNEFIRKELDNLLDAGIIVPSSAAWSFPVVIAGKKDGTARFCVDYRSLNKVMKADRWPLPRIEEIFDDLHKCTVFTTLDLFTGYWQVRMSHECKEMTAFVTRYGTFQFEVMPFGLMNAPSTFQRMMDVVLQNISFARVYIDDVVIFSKSIQEHMGHLKVVFRKLKECGLKVKLAKCHFVQKRVHLLGHVVDGDGIRVDDHKIAAIKQTPAPSTKTELRSFLGLAGYYRRFIKGFAEISATLHASTSGKRALSWTTDMEKAFETLKLRLTSPPVLAYPHFETPFVVKTNASCVSLGAVLVQKKESGKSHPVQYASRTMTETDRRYSTSEREALAVIFALKKFRVYLLSSVPFVIVTDHQALRHAFQKKDIHGRLARWLEFLAEYDFTISYRSGSQNVPADFLSRVATEAAVGESFDEGDLTCLAVSVDDFNGLEPHLKSIACYLMGLSILHLAADERRKIRRNAKKFAVWDNSFFRQVRGGLKFVPPIKDRAEIFRSYHDEIGHWDSRATRSLVADRFWWPTMYTEAHCYVQTCDDCQKMTRLPKYYSGLRAPLTSLFDVFSIDFAGPLPTTSRGNKHLFVCVEHLTGWAIACPTATATAAEVVSFVEEHIIMPFGRPRLFVSDNGPCFTATSLQKFMEEKGIKWKTVLAYAPMSNGRAERMVGTLKRSIGKIVHADRVNWDLVVSKVLYGYRRRNLATGFSPYELMYGTVPRMSLEYSDHDYYRDPTPEQRAVESMAVLTSRATHMEKAKRRCNSSAKSSEFKAGGFVLIGRGKALGSNIKWPPFSSGFYGPCMVTSIDHSRYGLTSAHNRYTRNEIHARRLVPYHPRTFLNVAPV